MDWVVGKLISLSLGWDVDFIYLWNFGYFIEDLWGCTWGEYFLIFMMELGLCLGYGSSSGTSYALAWSSYCPSIRC